MTNEKSPSLRAAHREFTRNALIDAAIRCFRDRGYNATTIDDIASRAGATVRTFYRHFADKSELLVPMRDHLKDEVALVIGDLNDIDVRDRTAVRHWLDAYVVMCVRIQKLTSAYWEAAYLNTDFAQRSYDSTFKLVELLSNVLDQSDARRYRAQAMRLTTLFSCLDRIAFVVSTDVSALRAKEILDEYSKILWNVLNNAPNLDAGSVNDF